VPDNAPCPMSGVQVRCRCRLMRVTPSVTVPTRRTQRIYDRWRDMDRTHVAVGALVEQTETEARGGALRSRLYRRRQMTSQSATRLVVRFDGEDQTVTIRPAPDTGHRGRRS
jgi:hypothetical protein